MGIPKGSIVTEYGGEIITTAEAKRRVAKDRASASHYFSLNASFTIKGYTTIEEATTHASTHAISAWGSFINHSSHVDNVYIAVAQDSMKALVISKRDLVENEELLFHYGRQAFAAHHASKDTC
jgi:SET domain-containing protein